MKKPRSEDYPVTSHYAKAMEKYKAFLANKAEQNVAYRERRAAKEAATKKAAAYAKAQAAELNAKLAQRDDDLRSRRNDTVEPTREEWLTRAVEALREPFRRIDNLVFGLPILGVPGRRFRRPGNFHGPHFRSEAVKAEVLVDFCLFDCFGRNSSDIESTLRSSRQRLKMDHTN